jgi:hypothetical protein
LLPGGATLTGMIPQSFPDHLRTTLLDPAIMVPPLLWIASIQSFVNLLARRAPCRI